MTDQATAGLTGANLVAGREAAAGARDTRATDPRTGERGALAFAEATPDEIAEAARAAASAAPELAAWPLPRRATLLRGIADALDDDADAIVATADAETALGEPRLRSELARATGQFRKLAAEVEHGGFLEAVIDHADPDDVPPRPDLRRLLVPLGPVAVFGAANFPLAFSVPGGDTAAALAAGCPVVVKGHPSHPATSERAARALLRGLGEAGAPTGALGLVQGAGDEVGAALVTAPEIAAVGFTGSEAGGRALFDLAAARDVPIPVYAEMGSLNPVFVTPAALAARGDEIADGLLASMTLGTGQFCTKPGIVVLPAGDGADAFAERLAAGAREHGGGPLLGARIARSLDERLAATRALEGVETLVEGGVAEGEGFAARPAVLRTTAERLLAEPALATEHFGPVALLVIAEDAAAGPVADALPGQLTATLHAEPGDADAARLLPALQARAGRVIFNGFPTGVAVAPAMHHGGPYPATTSSLHTSVGASAVRRFLRPVTFQNAPEEALPEALRDSNPLGIPRRVDGQLRPS